MTSGVYPRTEKHRKANSEARKKEWADPVNRQKWSETRKGNRNAVGPHKITSEQAAENGSKAKRRRRSSLERQLDVFMNSIEYKHDSELWIKHEGKRRQPDFVSYEEKKVIEIWSDYWHRGEDPQELVKWYEQAGWKAEVVWESEVLQWVNSLSVLVVLTM